MNKTLLFNLMLCATLTACGGGGGSSSSGGDGSKDDVVDTPDSSIPDTTTPDTTPDAFSFTEVLDLALSTKVTSNEITLAGMDNETSISIDGGEYSLNGSDFTAESGKADAGDTVVLQVTSANEFQTAASATLTVGTISAVFTTTTRNKDITPDAFSFNDLTNIDVNTDFTSNEVIISGIDNGVAISTTQGLYKINEGDFTSEAGAVNNGDKVTLLLNSGTDYGSQTTATLTVGDYTSNFTVETRDQDVMPDAFEFTDVTDAELDTLVASNPVTITGIDDGAPFLFFGAKYSINGIESHGGDSAVQGIINNGDVLVIYVNTGSDSETTYQAGVAIGSEDNAQYFNVTTRYKDSVPEFDLPVAFTDEPLNAAIISPEITFREFESDTILVTGAEFKINDGEWQAAGSTQLVNNDKLTLRLTTSHLYNTQTSSTVSGSGWSFNFDVTTEESGDLVVFVEPELFEDGSTVIEAQEELTLKFSESMVTTALEFGGDMLPSCGSLGNNTNCLNMVWSENNTVLTVSPKENFYWYSDMRSLALSGLGTSNDEIEDSIKATVLPVFETFQEADVVIGQSNFTSDFGGAYAYTLNSPRSVSINSQGENAVLYITDKDNQRVVKYDPIPSENFQSLTELFGQSSETTNNTGDSDSRLYYPNSAVEFNDRIYITDTYNNRGIWVDSQNFNGLEHNELSGRASAVVGQADFNQAVDKQCSQAGLDFTGGTDVVATKQGVQWLIADSSNDRIMIWQNPDESKGANASLVLGQPSFDECNSTSPSSLGLASIGFPFDVWSNGEKLIAATNDKRLLVWNEFPTQNNDIADFQIGQLDDYSRKHNAGQDTNQRGFATAEGIGGNDHQICVADSGNNRVLVWSTLPSSTNDLADIVIGQSDFTKRIANDADQDGVEDSSPSAQTLNYPEDCDMSMEQLFISDSSNDRVLIYNALNKHPGLN